jgi:peptidoglycan/LPS O-acetylase OafA/YrhL
MHYPSLDGLRGLAILTVLIGHFLPPRVSDAVGAGDSGVVLFFCLSGFLITNILLQALRKEPQLWRYLGRFYFRRSLRIFPVYYVALITCVAAGYTPVIDNFWRLASYTATFVPGLALLPSLGGASHLWSLSIEEQFYWLWPLLLFFIRGSLLAVVLSMVIAIVALKYAVALGVVGTPAADDLATYRYLFRSLPSCIDSLGSGALVAILADRSWRSARLLCLAPAIAGLLFLSLTAYRMLTPIDSWYRGAEVYGVLYFHSVIAISIVAIVWAINTGPIWFSNIFTQPFLIFTGRISYGMYAYHLLLAEGLSRWIGGRFGFLSMFVVTYAVATVSYYVMEQPFLAMKDRGAAPREGSA